MFGTIILRNKKGRNEGLSRLKIEFLRAQEMGSENIIRERERLKDCTVEIAKSSKEVVLGIMADNGSKAISILQCWVPNLGFKKGILRAVDENNINIPIDELKDCPVYVKYNSTDNGDAYMKLYNGENRGMIYISMINLY